MYCIIQCGCAMNGMKRERDGERKKVSDLFLCVIFFLFQVFVHNQRLLLLLYLPHVKNVIWSASLISSAHSFVLYMFDAWKNWFDFFISFAQWLSLSLSTCLCLVPSCCTNVILFTQCQNECNAIEFGRLDLITATIVWFSLGYD